MENWGILAALGTALAWGTYMVPFKKSHSSNLAQFQLLMALGIAVSGLIVTFPLGFSLTLNIYGLLSGFLWALANSIFLVAVPNLGLARAVPVASSLVISLSFLWGIAFKEMPDGILTGLFAIGFIILGVAVISLTGNTKAQNIKKGLFAAMLAGSIWGSQLVPLKIGQIKTADFFFSLCLGIFISALMIFAAKRVKLTKGAIKEGLLSGVIWNAGNLLSLISLSIIGLSKMGPISQSATLVAVFWGLFYFKELSGRKARLQILMGAAILFTGVVIMGFA